MFEEKCYLCMRYENKAARQKTAIEAYHYKKEVEELV
jgi:hypothetical protein